MQTSEFHHQHIQLGTHYVHKRRGPAKHVIIHRVEEMLRILGCLRKLLRSVYLGNVLFERLQMKRTGDHEGHVERLACTAHLAVYPWLEHVFPLGLLDGHVLIAPQRGNDRRSVSEVDLIQWSRREQAL